MTGRRKPTSPLDFEGQERAREELTTKALVRLSSRSLTIRPLRLGLRDSIELMIYDKALRRSRIFNRESRIWGQEIHREGGKEDKNLESRIVNCESVDSRRERGERRVFSQRRKGRKVANE